MSDLPSALPADVSADSLAVPSRACPVQFLGQPAIELLAADGSQATVLLQGAQVVSWKTSGGHERLYLSDRAAYAPGQAVRGGIPVIFPQFGQRGPLPRHGFARTSLWELALVESGPDDAMAVMRLSDDAASLGIWPHRFCAELTVRVGGNRLDVELAVTNTGDTALSFSAALHTYHRVADVAQVELSGLQRLRYADCLRKTEQVDAASALQIEGEIDRIYFNATRPLKLVVADSVTDIHSEGFVDAVVWNPGPAQCAGLVDMPADGYRRMVCVEAAVIGTPVRLAPADEWVGRQSLVANT